MAIHSKILGVVNQKGGVSKSTTVFALGAGLSLKGFKVLFIDLDAQGNLTYTLGVPVGVLNVLDIIVKRVEASEAIHKGQRWDYITSTPSLAGVDVILTQTRKEFRLSEALGPIKERYDFIIMDTPPALGILTVNALTACDGVIIPTQADIYSLQGIRQLYKTIKVVRQYCNPGLTIMGILLTRYSSRSILSRDIAEMIKEMAIQLETRVYKTAIREAVAVKEAQARQQDIFSYAPKGKATVDYEAFIEEVLSQ